MEEKMFIMFCTLSVELQWGKTGECVFPWSIQIIRITRTHFSLNHIEINQMWQATGGLWSLICDLHQQFSSPNLLKCSSSPKKWWIPETQTKQHLREHTYLSLQILWREITTDIWICWCEREIFSSLLQLDRIRCYNYSIIKRIPSPPDEACVTSLTGLFLAY